MSVSIIDQWADTILGLHANWEPHSGQQSVIDAIYDEQIKSIFIRCGRKWGKTEIALYLLWRTARLYPGSPCYYFSPQQNQARGILWEDPRLKNFGPREWLLDGTRGISEGDMVLRFKNDSFIKVDGSDNFNKYRGPRYKIAVYDEYKDADPRMRRAMRPNASVLDGIDVFMGSPPDLPGTDYQALETEHKLDKKKRAFHEPTWKNPVIPKQWLLDEKTALYLRGEGDEWEREDAAKYVKGGAASIFPMLDQKMMRPHAQVMAEISRDMKKLKWYWWADPAGATCFAVLFVAINPYNKKIYVLDEIYERDQKRMTVKVIGSDIIDKRADLNERGLKWRQGYDEAATWFLNEWIDNFPDEEGLEPTHKAWADKMKGLSLIKDIMLQEKLVISDRCKNFFLELENMKKDKNGKIPKVNDHLIDDFRYILAAECYELKPTHEYQEEADENFRGERLTDHFESDDEFT